MTKSITYSSAIKKMALLEQRANISVILNLFDKSLIMAVLFDSDKEKAFDEMMEVRNREYELGPYKRGRKFPSISRDKYHVRRKRGWK